MKKGKTSTSKLIAHYKGLTVHRALAFSLIEENAKNHSDANEKKQAEDFLESLKAKGKGKNSVKDQQLKKYSKILKALSRVEDSQINVVEGAILGIASKSKKDTDKEKKA